MFKPLSATKRLFWLQKHTQSPVGKLLVRSFGASSHGHHDDHHDDHGHGHHQHVEKADGDHKFISSEGSNKKFLFFNGLKASDPATVIVENPYRHHNDLPLNK